MVGQLSTTQWMIIQPITTCGASLPLRQFCDGWPSPRIA